jgi:hypothetical protein
MAPAARPDRPSPRAPGGGPKALTTTDPGRLDALVEPEFPLRWTTRACAISPEPSPVRAWKIQLARFTAEAALAVTVCHFPPGTSRWNKIEHRLFSAISANWRGRPLVSYEVIVELIDAATTRTGLRVQAGLDQGSYPLGA